MKPSDILKLALDRIKSGESIFVCIALRHSDMYKYKNSQDKAYQYILKYKPSNVREDSPWWKVDFDGEGEVIPSIERINALEAAIADAEANGE